MTRSILLTLLSLEALFGIKMSLLSSDAGPNLLKDNLNPAMKTERTEKLFNMMADTHTSLPRSQWTNYSESSTSQVKLYLEKALGLNKDCSLPQLQHDKWTYLLDIISMGLNSLPLLVKDIS